MLSRVRCAALRAMVLAGGEVSGEQLVRALRPVLGDLLPLPMAPADGDEARATAGRQAAGWELLDRRFSAAF